MRGFKQKIEWQRKVLKSVNSGLPLERQLPGLTKQVVLAWESTYPDQVDGELREMVLRAAELTGSINDFSAPVTIPIEDAQEELERLCIAIERATKPAIATSP